KLQALCAQFPELKEEAKRAFTSYLRSLILMGNRKVFDVKSIDIEAFASALGLEIAPKVRFIKKGQKQEQSTNEDKNNKNHEEEDKAEDEDDDDNDLFTIKKTSNTLEQTIIDLPESSQKEKKLTKAKLAKQLRKKNRLVNKHIDYDEDGNVIMNSDEDDQSSAYNIEAAKAHLQQMDEIDKQVYRRFKKRHKVDTRV
ncbi:unnamed protein product, partial [Rotaria magnacalcarata]